MAVDTVGDITAEITTAGEITTITTMTITADGITETVTGATNIRT